MFKGLTFHRDVNTSTRDVILMYEIFKYIYLRCELDTACC